MKEQKQENESKIDTRLLLPLALLHDACKVAPCYSWDDCDVFEGIRCADCPIKAATKFLEKGIEQ